MYKEIGSRFFNKLYTFLDGWMDGCLYLSHFNNIWTLYGVRSLTISSISLFRYHYLRGLVNTVSNRRLDALEDFQSLYKTDSDIFPSQMVKSLVDSLPESERLQVSSGCHDCVFYSPCRYKPCCLEPP